MLQFDTKFVDFGSYKHEIETKLTVFEHLIACKGQQRSNLSQKIIFIIHTNFLPSFMLLSKSAQKGLF